MTLHVFLYHENVGSINVFVKSQEKKMCLYSMKRKLCDSQVIPFA